MKKIMVAFSALMLLSITSPAQNVFVAATSKADSYFTLGYVKNGWGLYVGKSYNENLKTGVSNLISGEVPQSAKAGIIKTFNDRWMTGLGVKGSKINLFGAYSIVGSNDMKLWIIGDMTGGDNLVGGLGLSYNFEKKKK